MSKDLPLGEALVVHGHLNREQLNCCLASLREKRTEGQERVRLGDVLVELGFLTRQQVEDFVDGLHGRGSNRIRSEQAIEPYEFISTSSVDAPAVRYLNNLFRMAAREGISDVHFEDNHQGCQIRFRERGVLVIRDQVTQAFSREFDSKIRSKCRLSLVDRNVPLDSKFNYKVDGRDVDVRVSILPLADGKQSIVCRLLDSKANLITLDDIEMPSDIRRAINHAISQPQGLFLVTGPTGSGKTTTLYGILKKLNTPEVKIITAEDPIEYQIAGISQSQMSGKLTFATALKSMLRQDPDIILVGEIRDGETAKIAVQASLTGHIVLSTVHTNSALVTLERMLEMGVNPNALSASMGAFMAQRLVRKLCNYCKTPVVVTDYDRHQMIGAGIPEADAMKVEYVYEHNHEGCEHCNSGWAGRLPIFELFISTNEVRLAIEAGDIKQLEVAAKKQPHYRTLGHHAMQVAIEGKTTLLEAMAATGSTLVDLDEEEESASAC